MRSFLADFRFALRSFNRQPGPTALIVLTLTLGIAANTAVFAIVDGLFLRPFPFPEPDRLVYLNERAPTWNLEYTGINYPDFDTWRQRARAFDAMALWEHTSINLADASGAERAEGLAVTYDFPAVLGIRPLLGRTFTKEEDGPTRSRLIVIGHGLWRTRFGGSRDVVGQSLRVNSRPYTIIGVLPPEASFPSNTQFWIPLNGDPNQKGQSYSFEGIGRIKRGVTIDQARADLMNAHAPVWAQSDSAHVVSPRLSGLREQFVTNFRTMGKALGAGALLVLLIACANVAGMQLSRAVARRQELAVRAALGAGRARLVRQMVTESLVLAVCGGLAGVLLAVWGVKALVAAAAATLPITTGLGIDRTVLGVTLGVTVACGLVFGLVPALSASRGIQATLKDAGRGTSGGMSRHKLRTTLVMGQLALATVLLIGAGLLVRSLVELQRIDLGYSTDSTLTFEIGLPGTRYPTPESQDALFDQLYTRLAGLPGVVAVGGWGNLPLLGGSSSSLAIDGRPVEGKLPEVGYQVVSDDVFRAMRVPLKRGRWIGPADNAKAPRVALVSEGLAREYWPNADPIGARIRLGPDPSAPWITIVGIVGDVRRGVSGEPRATAYIPSRQDHWGGAAVVVRTAGDPMRLLPAVRREIKALDPALPVVEPQTVEDVQSAGLADRRLPMQLMSVFAALALVLAVIGVYGVMAYSVASRTREIGVRMALGAQPRSVFGMVLRQGLGAAAVGLTVGLAGAFALGGLLTKLLYGVSPRDLLTFASVSGALIAVTLAACLIPARRAVRVDPLEALRSE